MITVITAKRRQERTRFVLNCVDRAVELKQQLDARGFMTKMCETCDKVERTDEERNRATRIIGEIFGN